MHITQFSGANEREWCSCFSEFMHLNRIKERGDLILTQRKREIEQSYIVWLLKLEQKFLEDASLHVLDRDCKQISLLKNLWKFWLPTCWNKWQDFKVFTWADGIGLECIRYLVTPVSCYKHAYLEYTCIISMILNFVTSLHINLI